VLLAVLVVFSAIVMLAVLLFELLTLLVFLLLFLFPVFRILSALRLVFTASAFAYIVTVPQVGADGMLGDLDRLPFPLPPPRLVANLYAISTLDLGATIVFGAHAATNRRFRMTARSRPVAVPALAVHAFPAPVAIVVVLTFPVVIVVIVFFATAVIAFVSTSALVIVTALVTVFVVFLTTPVVALVSVAAIVIVAALVRFAAAAIAVAIEIDVASDDLVQDL
jgi:hypothetical protein